jgi:outer membrane protein assembly factor BamA
MKKILMMFLLGTVFINAQEYYINDVYIIQNEVFEKDDKDWFFAAPLLNKLHYNTRRYIIEDELLFHPGEPVFDDYIFETERNLRKTDFFTNVKIELDSVGPDLYDAYVITKERWSTYPAVLFGTGGGQTNYGAAIQEYNLLGTGTYVAAEGLHRTENNTGWQGFFELSQRRLFRSELRLDAAILANKYRTEQAINITKPYRTLDTRIAYGIYGGNQFGRDFLYSQDEKQLLPFHSKKVQLWFSKAWWRYDRVFITGLLSFEDVKRLSPEYEQAFDNSGYFLMNFSSVSRDYYTIKNVNTYHLEDLPVGGYGSAMLGKVFPVGSKGESLYYAAGQGEKSYFYKNFYAFGKLSGGSGFFDGTAKYTYQDFEGQMFYKFDKHNLIAMRVIQQAVWNWPRLRQLILDNDYGLRGYEVNRLTGENRLIANFEYRVFPEINLWLFDLSGAAFYDLGTVWNQTEKLKDVQWYGSVGAGLRFHFTKSSSPDHLFRIDFAYNLYDKKFGGVVFTTKQMFSVFKTHEFKLPRLFGREFDSE